MLQIQSQDSQGDTTTVTLTPQQGAQLQSYATRLAGLDLHWLAPADADRGACFAMVPFCSRVSFGKFSYRNQSVVLPSNNPPEAHAIHGHGFQRAWEVIETQRDTVLLGYEYPAQAWLWPYRARLRYRVTGRRLHVEAAVTNLAAATMPLGLGLHPYFPRTRGVVVQAQVAQWLQLDAQLLPVALSDIPPELDLRHGLTLSQQTLDHVFTGWNGTALLTWPASGEAPARQISLQSSCPYLVVWAPDGEDYFCVEGVSNLPDAFNGKVAEYLDGEPGFVQLGPQEVYRCSWTFDPQLQHVD